MKEDNEWGQTYYSEYGINKYGKNEIISNMQQIPREWSFRVCYKDEKGNMYLKPGKGRKRFIEINPHLNDDGEPSSTLLATIRAVRTIKNDLSEIESICLEVEKGVYEKLNKKK